MPAWKDAPLWAQWLARDFDGEWYWYENKPILSNRGVYLPNGGESAYTGICCNDLPVIQRPTNA